jgi:hypothetical protein
MVESAKHRFSTCPDRAREHWELMRLGEVEGFIQKRASQFSGEDPMLAEDLAQQAREAVIKRLREYPECPYHHLVVKARDAIFRYRQKGNSVDGLLYQRGRARQYDILSLEEPIDKEAEPSEEAPPLGEILSEPVQPRRFTEERAMAEVLLDTLRAYLCPKGKRVLTLRLRGFTWKEIQKDLKLGYREMETIKKDLIQKSQMVWGQNI